MSDSLPPQSPPSPAVEPVTAERQVCPECGARTVCIDNVCGCKACGWAEVLCPAPEQTPAPTIGNLIALANEPHPHCIQCGIEMRPPAGWFGRCPKCVEEGRIEFERNLAERDAQEARREAASPVSGDSAARGAAEAEAYCGIDSIGRRHCANEGGRLTRRVAELEQERDELRKKLQSNLDEILVCLAGLRICTMAEGYRTIADATGDIRAGVRNIRHEYDEKLSAAEAEVGRLRTLCQKQQDEWEKAARERDSALSSLGRAREAANRLSKVVKARLPDLPRDGQCKGDSSCVCAKCDIGIAVHMLDSALASVPEAKGDEKFPPEIENARVAFGLRAQGRMATVEQMRSEGKSWDEIGKAIGWSGSTVERFYELERVDAAPPSPATGATGATESKAREA